MILKCPKCKNELIRDGYSRYQNLIEHVSEPNRTPSMKEEYRCKYKCYPHRVFWDCYGDVYIPPSLLERLFWIFKIYRSFNRPEVPNAIKIENNKQTL